MKRDEVVDLGRNVLADLAADEDDALEAKLRAGWRTGFQELRELNTALIATRIACHGEVVDAVFVVLRLYGAERLPRNFLEVAEEAMLFDAQIPASVR